MWNVNHKKNGQKTMFKLFQMWNVIHKKTMFKVWTSNRSKNASKEKRGGHQPCFEICLEIESNQIIIKNRNQLLVKIF